MWEAVKRDKGAGGTEHNVSDRRCEQGYALGGKEAVCGGARLTPGVLGCCINILPRPGPALNQMTKVDQLLTRALGTSSTFIPHPWLLR